MSAWLSVCCSRSNYPRSQEVSASVVLTYTAALVAGAVIVLVGVIDDRWGLDALTKFVGQVTAAGVLVVMGVSWFIIYNPFGGDGGSTIILDQIQSGLFTVAVAVATINAMNFVDGLDGLAAGLGLIAALAILIFSIGLLHDQGRRRECLPAGDDRGGFGRRLSRFSSTQLQSSAHFHGRFRVDVDRSHAGRDLHQCIRSYSARCLRNPRPRRPPRAVVAGRGCDVHPDAGHCSWP